MMPLLVADSVIVAFIAGGFGVLSTLILNITSLIQNVKLKKQGAANSAAVEVVREQVQNSHGTNLRDDLDVVLRTVAEHEAAQKRYEGNQQELKGTVEGISSDIRGMRADIGRLDRRDIENTATRREENGDTNRRFRGLETALENLRGKGTQP